MKIKIDDQTIIDACNTSVSMSQACVKVGIHMNTFIRHAKRLGVYKPNMGLKGGKKPKKEGNGKIPLSEILEGKHPQYQTFKLKNRLFEEGLKENKCEQCGISEWRGFTLMCELDHINGESTDHRFSNLKILCPNCHSQTDTFRAKNKRNC